MKTRKEEWYTDPAKLQQLAVLLDSDIFKEAMAVLTEEMLPTDDGAPMPSAETLTFAAMNYKKLAGFCDYPRKLAELCRPEFKGPRGAPKAYSDDYVKEYAKKSGLSLSDTTDQPT